MFVPIHAKNQIDTIIFFVQCTKHKKARGCCVIRLRCQGMDEGKPRSIRYDISNVRYFHTWYFEKIDTISITIIIATAVRCSNNTNPTSLLLAGGESQLLERPLFAGSPHHMITCDDYYFFHGTKEWPLSRWLK